VLCDDGSTAGQHRRARNLACAGDDANEIDMNEERGLNEDDAGRERRSDAVDARGGRQATCGRRRQKTTIPVAGIGLNASEEVRAP
jgi:hypothetical protein